MKIAYRIITPILSIGAIVMGIMLKLFHFAIGGATEELGQLATLLQAFKVKTNFEFSVVDIVKLLLGMDPEKESDVDFTGLIEPIFPELIAFVIFFVIALLLFVAIGGVSAASNKRGAVIGVCAAGLVVCFIAIFISNSAFSKIMEGQIPLSDLVTTFSKSEYAALLALAAAVVKITSATLSAAFYGVFGMYILIILWTVMANMLIKNPIQFEKKHRRKKPLKSVSAIFRK